MDIDIDTLTVIIGTIVVALAILTPMFSAFFRRPSVPDNNVAPEPSAATSFSVIIPVLDHVDVLKRNLQSILEQDYAHFEVIVVDESPNDDVKDILDQLKEQYPHLYTTFIPESSHYLSRRKLALTLGVKAAHHDWIVFTEADCHPVSNRWLTTLASHIEEGTDMVIGYTGYEQGTRSYWRFERFQTMLYQMRRTQRGTAYRCAGYNLAFRKSLFAQHNGFLANLKYLRGEYDFVANEYATEGRTAIANEPDAYIKQEMPSKKTWIFEHLYYLEARKHMQRGFAGRLLFNTDQALLYLNDIVAWASLAYALYSHNLILTIATPLAMLINTVLRMFIIYRAKKEYGEDILLWKIPWMERKVVWKNLSLLLRYLSTDKYDLIRR